MKLKILTVPNPLLRQKSQPVTKIDKKVLKFIADFEETLVKKTNPPGVGLSAPQVGKLWRIFATYLPREGKRKLTIFINPQILQTSKLLTLGGRKPLLEGCLSIPKIYGPVWRHQWIKLRFIQVNQSLVNQLTSRNKNNRLSDYPINQLAEKTVVFSGFAARVLQHEHDHLEGILFTDRSLKDKLPLYEGSRSGKLTPIDLPATNP